ncbi:MAG: hypothetical protein RLY14_871 [Planctomycetota bacterium]|jgi:hypothetical protein
MSKRPQPPSDRNCEAVRRNHRKRRGTATLEELLVLSVMLPAVALSFYASIRIFRAIYSVIAILVSWPSL